MEINKKIEKIKSKIFKKMLYSGGGQYLSFLAKWKALPEKKDYALLNKTNTLERRLTRFV